jgi:hypothetical protein
MIVIGLLIFLVIHPFINRNAGKNYTDRLTKIYGGFAGPLIVSIAGSWFGDTLFKGIEPEVHSFSITGAIIGSVALLCIWDYVLIRAGKK